MHIRAPAKSPPDRRQAAKALLAEARALKAAGRLDEALEVNRRAVAADPASGIAEHNLAATLGDLSRFAEAEEAASRAAAKGVDAPETWLVRARALQGLGRLDEAEAAFAAAIARRALYLDAQRDLAQLRWMRSADAATATAAIDQALATAPDTVELLLLKARVLGCAGEETAAGALLAHALARQPGHAPLHLAAAELAARAGDADAQLRHATAALRLTPASTDAARAAVEALLHAGRAAEAEQLALRVQAATPLDQAVLALLGTAWRLMGDPRHAALCDDARLVSTATIATPPGWPDREAYLADLANALRARHAWRTHPLEQSLRHGSQTQEDLTRSDDPAIRALFVALDPLIRAHIAALGKGTDPVRARATGDYRIVGAWSVLLRPGGFHVDHVHPQGWLSSAFYIALPEAVERGHEGWLAFGRPGIPTRPPLAPTRFVRPEPGMLVLFPSYFWHGTEPFTGGQPRLTVAFDIVPA
ncbi:putative 2OG-Fe(II) oxygenase [Sphingomonas quercus]|uniref:Tetratricopeptide repeat protein n=1 Tax=Sphingomonas quercus TaxID=2842451 RepID=A0ABS6BD68_9SPHN|nr:putative 2OG-Fe(II) oxygenase [Sphingomonas quercus]MBU3076260.1 hypothetical protein [Sphingomonas quercus]